MKRQVKLAYGETIYNGNSESKARQVYNENYTNFAGYPIPIYLYCDGELINAK